MIRLRELVLKLSLDAQEFNRDRIQHCVRLISYETSYGLSDCGGSWTRKNSGAARLAAGEGLIFGVTSHDSRPL